MPAYRVCMGLCMWLVELHTFEADFIGSAVVCVSSMVQQLKEAVKKVRSPVLLTLGQGCST